MKEIYQTSIPDDDPCNSPQQTDQVPAKKPQIALPPPKSSKRLFILVLALLTCASAIFLFRALV